MHLYRDLDKPKKLYPKIPVLNQFHRQASDTTSKQCHIEVRVKSYRCIDVNITRFAYETSIGLQNETKLYKSGKLFLYIQPFSVLNNSQPFQI